jgi:hypothetical protein
MPAQAAIISLRELATIKQRLRAAEELALVAGLPPEPVGRESAFLDPALARRARIRSIGRRFPAAAFDA